MYHILRKLKSKNNRKQTSYEVETNYSFTFED